MPTAATVLADYHKLPTVEQNEVKSALIHPSFVSGITTDALAADVRFKDGRVCLICGCKGAVRNGRRPDGKQRYLCKDCGKSFVASSNSIISRSRKALSVWEKHIECMLSGFSLRRTAYECGISKTTAFIWRHKTLDALQHMADSVRLDGIIEGDETFFAVSYKGNHSKSKRFTMPRPAHKRGSSVHKRGLSSEQVCVPCAVNRDGLSISKVSNLAGIRTAGLNAVYGGRIERGSVFVSDGDTAYRKFAAAQGIGLKQLKSGTVSRQGLYHLQHINSFHSALKLFMLRFRGVSTKYLNGYLVWNNYVNYSKSEYVEKKKKLLRYIVGLGFYERGVDIACRDSLPMVA